MPRPRRRRAIAAALAVVAVVLVGAALAATGRLPALAHAWGELVSTGAPSSSVASSPPAGDAGVSGDAGAKPRRQATPLSSAQLGAPLVHGTFVTACGAPDDMKVVVKVAVKLGRATDVDVRTDPFDPVVTRCIEKAVGDLQWDVSKKTEHLTVRY